MSVTEMMMQGEQWVEDHDCLIVDETDWDSESDWSNWSGESDWSDEEISFNSTEDMYWFFIQHVEMNCPQHYEAAAQWADGVNKSNMPETEIMMQGEYFLEDHDCLESNETDWESESDWSNWETDEDWSDDETQWSASKADEIYWFFIQHVEMNCPLHY